jgi:hypothetical protein
LETMCTIFLMVYLIAFLPDRFVSFSFASRKSFLSFSPCRGIFEKLGNLINDGTCATVEELSGPIYGRALNNSGTGGTWPASNLSCQTLKALVNAKVTSAPGSSPLQCSIQVRDTHGNPSHNNLSFLMI